MTDITSKPRRRSWFQKNGGLTSFFMTGTGTPSSNRDSCPPTMTQQPTALPSPPSGSQSMDMESDIGATKSTLASRISKAARRGLKRIPTSVDLQRRLDDTSDSSSSHKRSKVIPLTAPCTPPSEEDKKLNDSMDDDTFITTNEAEADRIQFKSDLIRLAFDGEFPIPIDFQELHGGKILDIGCGPGSYCMEIAERYPHVDVYGIDIVDIFPLSPLHTNCTFLVINALDEKSLFDQFDEESLDFIHIRFMSLSFTKEQYKRVVNNCWKLLKPGGYLELLEMDMMIYSPGPTTEEMNHDMLAAARSRGLKPRMARHLWSLFPKDATCSVEKYHSLPLGVWGGRLGVMSRDDMFNIMENCQSSINDYKAANHIPNRMTTHTFEILSEVMAKEFERHHSYINFYFTVGQKALVSSSS